MGDINWNPDSGYFLPDNTNQHSTLDIDNVMLRFKLRLNVEEWGVYKKGDEDHFNIKLHDEQNGLTRFPIDKRWDVISCNIVNIL